jgi:molybdopterin-guanine dinucleotide biosynthesis protein B
MFKIISITGYSNSGKTTLIKKIISRLTQEGFKVAALKSSNSDADIDKDGKDTSIFSESGAEISVFLNNKSTAIFVNKNTKFRDLTVFFSNIDYVIVEGNIEEPIIKLRLDDRYEEDDLSIPIKDKNFDEIYEIVKNESTILLPNRPNCGYCGEKDCFEMMKKIIQKKRKVQDCVILKEQELSLEVDEEKIGLPPFLRKMVKDVNVGMLKNLKLPKNFSKVRITIDGDSIRS